VSPLGLLDSICGWVGLLPHPRVPLTLTMTLALLSGVLQSCDSGGARKEAEGKVLSQVVIPPAFRLVDRSEGGNGGGSPVVVYEFLGSGRPSAHDFRFPPGYESANDLGESSQVFPGWVEALNREVNWYVVDRYEGPSPDGEGDCQIRMDTNKDESMALIRLVPTCDL
jgi:hypothetical protein